MVFLSIRSIMGSKLVYRQTRTSTLTYSLAKYSRSRPVTASEPDNWMHFSTPRIFAHLDIVDSAKDLLSDETIPKQTEHLNLKIVWDASAGTSDVNPPPSSQVAHENTYVLENLDLASIVKLQLAGEGEVPIKGIYKGLLVGIRYAVIEEGTTRWRRFQVKFFSNDDVESFVTNLQQIFPCRKMNGTLNKSAEPLVNGRVDHPSSSTSTAQDNGKNLLPQDTMNNLSLPENHTNQNTPNVQSKQKHIDYEPPSTSLTQDQLTQNDTTTIDGMPQTDSQQTQSLPMFPASSQGTSKMFQSEQNREVPHSVLPANLTAPGNDGISGAGDCPPSSSLNSEVNSSGGGVNSSNTQSSSNLRGTACKADQFFENCQVQPPSVSLEQLYLPLEKGGITDDDFTNLIEQIICENGFPDLVQKVMKRWDQILPI